MARRTDLFARYREHVAKAGSRLGKAVAISAVALATSAGSSQASFRGPDRPVVGPAAKQGSALARKSGLSAGQLRTKLRDAIRGSGGVNGVYVDDLSRRQGKLMGYHADHSLILASNTKLFSTAAYLERFGAKRRFATRLWARGHRAGRGDHTLVGSLALVGAGDPALASPTFAAAHHLPLTSLEPMAIAVRRAGIRKVKGGIKADPTIFDGQTMPHQTGITGLNLGSLSGLEFDSGWVNGQPVSSPATLASSELKHDLEQEGVNVTGPVSVGSTPRSLRSKDPVKAVDSPTTAAIITEVNTPSDATWAEMITKRLGVAGTKQGTTARGAKRIERFTRSIGSHVSLENGSGLSRIDRASANDVVALLAHMNRVSDAGVYRHSLARPCATGTVADRMCGTAAAGHCQVKTGTLADVSALSGYCNAHGHRVAFAILMNAVSNFDAAHHAQDRMTALIARFSP